MRWQHIFPIWVLLASSATLAQEPPAPTPAPAEFPEVVARVNGTEITKKALLDRAEALKAQIPPAAVGPDFYRRVLDDIVSGELLFQSVEKKGLAPSDQEVNAELETQKGRLGGEEQFQETLQSQGLSVEDVRRELKKEMGIQKLIEQDFVPQVEVTDEEKRQFYQENSEEMQRPEQYRVSHILIGVEEEASEEKKAEAKQKATSILSMVEAGQDFAELARRNSEDPGSKSSGGELPWMSQGQTVPAFEAAAMALQPGETSGVVETQFGYHIIRLHEKRAAGLAPYEEVEPQIDQFLKRRDLQERIESELRTLKSQGNVEVFI